MASRAAANDVSTVGGNLGFEQRVQRRVVARVQRFERQLILGEKADRGGIEDGRRRPRIHQRHRHAEVLVDRLQLSEIRELAGTGDVAGGREERVLHDRTQQHAGTESGGLIAGLLEHGVDRVALVAHDERAVLLANDATRAVEAEERHAVVLRVDLRVVAARHHVGAGRRREAGRLTGRRQLAHEDARRERLRRPIRRVVDDQAARAEHPLDPPRERIGHADAGGVGLAEIVEQRRREFRRRKNACELVDDRLNRGVQRDLRDRRRGLRPVAAEGRPCAVRAARRTPCTTGPRPSRGLRPRPRRPRRPAPGAAATPRRRAGAPSGP